MRRLRFLGQFEYYLDRSFKSETLIPELCPPDKKGRVREHHIHSGAVKGVRKGDLFLV